MIMLGMLRNVTDILTLCREIKGLLSSNINMIKGLQKNLPKSSTMSSFRGRSDRFEGITILSEDESCNSEAFQDVLERSLAEWTNQNKRGIWFKVNLKQADWIPVLANNGFKYHHAQGDYVMMYKWLPRDEECNIPPYAHTMIGVGAVVINDKNEVLVVTEKHFLLPHWKLPGGYVEPGENIVDAAIREVYEETNIHTEFRSVLSFRHAHRGQFQCSDLYVVVSLKPKSLEIKKCDREISDSKWMDVDEYLKHPHIHELNRFFVKKYLENKSGCVKIDCAHGIHQVLKKPYTVYHVVNDSESSKL